MQLALNASWDVAWELVHRHPSGSVTSYDDRARVLDQLYAMQAQPAEEEEEQEKEGEEEKEQVAKHEQKKGQEDDEVAQTRCKSRILPPPPPPPPPPPADASCREGKITLKVAILDALRGDLVVRCVRKPVLPNEVRIGTKSQVILYTVSVLVEALVFPDQFPSIVAKCHPIDLIVVLSCCTSSHKHSLPMHFG